MFLRRRYGASELPVGNSEPTRDEVTEGSARRTLFVWGWLRLALGCAQMVLSIWGLILFLKMGGTIETGIVVGVAFLAFAASRWIYRGRKPPGGRQDRRAG